MVFNATFNNISATVYCGSVLLVEEIGVLAENRCKSLTNLIILCCIEYTLSVSGIKNSVMIGTDYTGSFKSNYCIIRTTTTSSVEGADIPKQELIYTYTKKCAMDITSEQKKVLNLKKLRLVCL